MKPIFHTNHLRRIPPGAILAVCLVIIGAFASSAQVPPPPDPRGGGEVLRVRGTVVRLTETTLSITDRDGKPVDLQTAPEVGVQYSVRMDFTKIVTNSIAGSTAIPGAEGQLTALEVHMFPPGGGPPPSQRPSDLKPGSILSTGKVLEVNATPHHRSLKLQCGEKEVTIAVPDDASVVTYEKADRGAVQPGVKAYLHAKIVDGHLQTISITVGKDGITPPL